MSDDDTYAEFSDAVNMTAKQIEDWLQTEESKRSGRRRAVAGSPPGTRWGVASSPCSARRSAT